MLLFISFLFDTNSGKLTVQEQGNMSSF